MNIDFDFGCYGIMTVSVILKLQSLLLDRFKFTQSQSLNFTIVKQYCLTVDLCSSVELVARE